MHKCDVCDRELKSKAGLLRHRKACIIKQAEEFVNDIENPEDEIHVDDVFDIPIGIGQVSIDDIRKIVTLEVLGGEETYYDGHPRRLIKLKGLLSRTPYNRERIKIRNMILELM